jgi:L-ascorbate oxidase
MDQATENYWIQSEMVPGPGPRNGRAILNYEGAPDPSLMRRKIFKSKSIQVSSSSEMWEWSHNLSPNPDIRQPDIYLMPESVDREIIIRSAQRNSSDGATKFDINGKFYKEPNIPYLFQVRQNGVNITKEPQVFQSETNKSIQMIFQNVVSEEGKCEQHPWHLHGHTFYVIAHGPGEYDPKKDSKDIEESVSESNNNSTFAFRDVVTLCPSIMNMSAKDNNNSNISSSSSHNHHSDHSSIQHSLVLEGLQPGSGCGWVAIRFVTDNPGVWLVHCHLTAHLMMGKQFVFYSYQKTNPRLSLPFQG